MFLHTGGFWTGLNEIPGQVLVSGRTGSGRVLDGFFLYDIRAGSCSCNSWRPSLEAAFLGLVLYDTGGCSVLLFSTGSWSWLRFGGSGSGSGPVWCLVSGAVDDTTGDFDSSIPDHDP